MSDDSTSSGSKNEGVGTIRKKDLEDLKALTGMSSFTPLAFVYGGAELGEEGTKELKDAILSDLTAWNTLGSFIASIAFGGLLLGRVDNPKVPNLAWIYEVADRLSPPPRTGWSWFLFSLNPTEVAELESNLVWWWELAYSVLMTFSGFCGLRSVVAATLKYLYVNAIPHTAILPGIALFRNSVYRQGNNVSKSAHFGVMLWDHTNSVMLSIQSLGAGFVVACSMIYGVPIAVVVAIVSVGLWGIIKKMHRQWEDAQEDLLKLRPPSS